MEPETAPLPEGKRFEGRYEILGELGRGRFGRVYRARQLSTGQPVAIKLLDPHERMESSSTAREAERFRRETGICAALSHPHLVQLIDSGETAEGRLYAVFAYVPGETLEHALAREGAVGVRESLRLMTQVLEALACAHAKGIVHRDLKPSNLMLTGTAPRRNAVVLDFGVGGLVEGRRRAEWETLTQAREFVGTPRYASPEQLAGEPATLRSDLYSWGLIFLECATGIPPFSEEGAAARLLTGGGAVQLPGWLREHRLGALLETVTARDAARRELSVEDLLEALDEIARGKLPDAPEGPPTPPPLAASGEHRHLTVMFCDLVESTALARQLDAEAYGRILRAYQERSEQAIERYDGHVAQHLGDGLLVYFGHPQAHDDDPERAVRAGRDILRDLRTLNGRLEAEQGIRLAVRVGIHTGPVVVRETGGREKRETLALGDTPNIAARLADVAEPDTVVISEVTRRLVAGRVVTEDRGAPPLKGVAEPLAIHRVVQTLPRPFTPVSAMPFVGREQELDLLLDRFAEARERRGQAAWIAGEPGIGKTRLVQQFRGRLGDTPHGWLECRGSPYTRNSALSPVVELLEQALRLDEVDDPAEKVSRLEIALELADFELGEAVPLLASLLSVRLPARYARLEISPQLQRQKTLEALLSWVLALGEKQPLVLVVEDLQWVDPSTLEWLGLVIEQCPMAAMLVLVTFRPEFEPAWPTREHLHPITLSRLSARQAQELVARAMPARAPPPELVERIASRSDGVPLFAEELAKSVAEAGSADALDIPETLQDSLMARLDRLGELKEVAQLASAIGHEFDYGLLKAVAPLKEGALREGLGRLVATELVYQRGLPPKAIYSFKHALVRDTAYQSLLESQRRELHGRIADALEQRFPDRFAREPERIARHCESAGRAADAIGHYRRAGEGAMQRWACAEASGHLHRAIEILRTLPESAERDRQELPLLVALGPPLIAAKGYGDREVERVYARARELCQRIGRKPELVRVFLGLSMFHHNRGELRTAADLAEQALSLAARGGEAYPLLAAHTRLGISLYMLGELPRAHEQLERAVDLYHPAEHRSLSSVWGHDWGIFARAFDAMCATARGYPERARRLIRETVELAREGDPFSLAFALGWAAQVYSQLGERHRVSKPAEEALAIARERGFLFVRGWATIYRGVAIDGGEGLEEIRRGLALTEEARATVYVPGWSLHLAEAHQELGQTQAALAALDSVAADLPHVYRWQSWRIRGELLAEQQASEEAESCLLRALEITRRQDARFYELQVATSLARLLRDQERRDEARALLQPVYDWFTEGFDTPALKGAKALLEELT